MVIVITGPPVQAEERPSAPEAERETPDTPPLEERPVASADDFDSLVNRGLELTRNHRYEEATVFFQRAYEIDPIPELIYNTARAYERAVDRARAIEYYERFLSLQNTTARTRRLAIEHLREVRDELAAIENLEQSPSTTHQSTPADTSSEEVDEQVPEEPPVPLETQFSRVGWSLSAIGGASIVAGGVMGIIALRQNSDFESTNTYQGQLNLQTEINRNAVIADILYGIGAAIVTTGVIFLVVRIIRMRRNQADSQDSEYESEPLSEEAGQANAEQN